MSLASWEPDPKLTREKHKWVFVRAYPQEWGATVEFCCQNPGCATTLSLPCEPGDGVSRGICFDRIRSKQLTDRDGNPIAGAQK